MNDAPVILPTDELLTLPQVAEELGITRPTARVWSLHGRFPSREIAGRTYVRRQDLERFKEELRRERGTKSTTAKRIRPANDAVRS